VSSPASCSSYAFNLLINPMPRPSCGKYSSTPAGSFAICRNENSSCARQSQRSDVNTSPVRHCEWTRTSGAPRRKLPRWIATASSLALRPVIPNTVNRPKLVGSCARATTCARLARPVVEAFVPLPDCFARFIRIGHYTSLCKIASSRHCGLSSAQLFTSLPALANVTRRNHRSLRAKWAHFLADKTCCSRWC